MAADKNLDANEVIKLLGLQPHPEGGHYRETFRDPLTLDRRAASTAIYFLLREGEISAWHRVDAAELWHWHAGAPLRLLVAENGGPARTHLLGCDLKAGERPQGIVPARAWQSASSCGAWSLAGCTVAPGFEFSAFEMAPAGWQPESPG